MLVDRSQLIQYGIAEDLYFARRTGDGTPISRDAFFIANPSRLENGMFCAIGSDENGWALEQFNSVNWATIEPDPSYSLIITQAGLAAINNVTRGGIQLFFSGIKIINRIVTDPAVPVINWTDADLMQQGQVVFSVGTQGSKNIIDPTTGNTYINQILRWRFNTAAGGLQYIVTLPPEGLGSTADDGSEQWEVGTIGLYVKDPSNNTTDVLFGVATLPELVTKYASNIDFVGNSIKLYFNAVCNNLGIISNLEMMTEDTQSLPEVQNETLLNYPYDTTKRPHNCYVVDNLYGSGLPALAIPRSLPTIEENADWLFIQPNENFIKLTSDAFADDVTNYRFVYYNQTTSKYELAEGKEYDDTQGGYNEKTPVGVRVGNSIVFAGEVTNDSTAYKYTVTLASGGENYAVNDEVLVVCNDGVTFKLKIVSTNANGSITGFSVIGPDVGNIDILGNPIILPAIYDPRSQLPRYGTDAKFLITSTAQANSPWNFPAEWYNKPLYCGYGDDKGNAINSETDSFIGWCTGKESIRLALDLRNEATYTSFGISRFATDTEVKESTSFPVPAEQTMINPKTLKDNYLQTSLPAVETQAGGALGNPIQVESYVRFDKIVLGKGTSAPYDNTTQNPNVTDDGISFYGTSYRAYWADLAEFYEADKYYEPGTLITLGKGEKELSIATTECNGIISTKPGYQLGEKKSELSLPVALVGRVPVLMDGQCMPKFGDKIYLSKLKKGCASTIENGKCLGKIIEKNFGTNKLVECAVRIEF